MLLTTMTETGIVNICLVNRTTSDAKVRIAIGSGGSPALGEYIEYDATLQGNQPLERGGRSLSVGDKIWIRSTVAGISARAEGVPST